MYITSPAEFKSVKFVFETYPQIHCVNLALFSIVKLCQFIQIVKEPGNPEPNFSESNVYQTIRLKIISKRNLYITLINVIMFTSSLKDK